MQFVWQRVEKKLVKCTCFFFAAQRSRFKIVHHTTIRGKSRGAPEKEPYCESQFLPSIIICQCLLNLNNDSWNFHVIYKTFVAFCSFFHVASEEKSFIDRPQGTYVFKYFYFKKNILRCWILICILKQQKT